MHPWRYLFLTSVLDLSTVVDDVSAGALAHPTTTINAKASKTINFIA